MLRNKSLVLYKLTDGVKNDGALSFWRKLILLTQYFWILAYSQGHNEKAWVIPKKSDNKKEMKISWKQLRGKDLPVVNDASVLNTTEHKLQ